MVNHQIIDHLIIFNTAVWT